MANYLQSQQPTFSNWKPPVDYSIYKGALDEKESQYQQNAQKIQGYLDTVAGLPVGNEADKKYLQSLTNNLYTKVNNVAASDLSDQNLVSKLKGFASNIYGDPIVQRAMNSAANVQSATTKLNQAQQSGRGYGVENEAFLQKQIQEYMQAPEAGAAFRSSYTPYVDIIKKVTDNLTTSHRGSKVTYSGTDVNSPVMDKFTVEGADPIKVRSEIRKMIELDGGIKQQMGINSWYNYKGIEGDNLHMAVDNTFSSTESQLEKEKKYYQELAIDNAGNPAALAQIKKNLEQLDLTADNIKKQKETLTNLAQTDPDQVKSYLYRSSLEGLLMDKLSNQKIDQAKSENPLYKAALEATTKDVEYKKDVIGFAIKLKEDEARVMNTEADNLRADQKLAQSGTKGTGAGSSGGTSSSGKYVPGMANTTDVPQNAFEHLVKQEQELTNQYNAEKTSMLATLPTVSDMFELKTIKDKDGRFVDEFVPKKGRDTEIQKKYNEFEAKWKNGEELPGDVQRFFDKNKENIYLRNQLQSTLLNAKNQVDQEFKAEYERDPEFKLYKKYEDVRIDPVIWKNNKGENIKIDKRDLLLYFNSPYTDRGNTGDILIRSGKYEAVKDYVEHTLKTTVIGPNGRPVPNPAYKELEKLNNLTLEKSDGRFSQSLITGENLTYHTGKEVEKLNQNLRRNLTAQYDVASVIPSETTKDLANAIGMAKRLYAAKTTSEGKQLIPSEFNTGMQRAAQILNGKDDKADSKIAPTFSYHPETSTKSAYIEIIGDVSQPSGEIPVSKEEAIGSGLFVQNPTAFLDKALSYGVKMANGNQVVAEAKQLPIGRINTTPKQDGTIDNKYNLSYDVKQQNNEFIVTLNVTDLKDPQRKTFPITLSNPFSSKLGIVEWANNLERNPNTTALVIQKTINQQGGQLPVQTPQQGSSMEGLMGRFGPSPYTQYTNLFK